MMSRLPEPPDLRARRGALSMPVGLKLKILTYLAFILKNRGKPRKVYLEYCLLFSPNPPC